MKISIVIPTYNSQKTVRKAIDSVLKQKFLRSKFEVIVINDGSTDNTLNIIKSYGKKIKIINQKNQGVVKATNKGFKVASGDYVIKLDADDFFRKNALKIMAEVLRKNSKIDFVYSDYYEKSYNGRLKIISTKNNIFNTVGSGIMFKRDKLAKQGFYRRNIKFPEYDLLLKILKKWHGYHIAKPLFYYVRRKDSITANKKWVKEALKELEKIHYKEIQNIKKIRKY